MIPSEALKALQASERSELLDSTRANCWSSAQYQPSKFALSCGKPEDEIISIVLQLCLSQNAKTKQFQKPSNRALANSLG
jgi:hypothetical protein